MLTVTDAVVRYGSIEALHGISFDVEQGEIVTLLGANGAGKSTTLRMVSGLHAVASGSIVFEGHDISKIKAHEFVSMGCLLYTSVCTSLRVLQARSTS